MTDKQKHKLKEQLDSGEPCLQRVWKLIEDYGRCMPESDLNDVLTSYEQYKGRLEDMQAVYRVKNHFFFLGKSYKQVKRVIANFRNECSEIETKARAASKKVILADAAARRSPKEQQPIVSAEPVGHCTEKFFSHCNFEINNNNTAFAGAHKFQMTDVVFNDGVNTPIAPPSTHESTPAAEPSPQYHCAVFAGRPNSPSTGSETIPDNTEGASTFYGLCITASEPGDVEAISQMMGSTTTLSSYMTCLESSRGTDEGIILMDTD